MSTLKIITAKKNDLSGPRSQNRFSYQNHFGLIKTLQLHEGDADYIILFDYVDDVLVLINDNVAEFYQVKTKESGIWKFKEIAVAKVKSKKAKKVDLKDDENVVAVLDKNNEEAAKSFLEKMQKNYTSYKDEVANMQFNFVSNIGFDMKLIIEKKSTDLMVIKLQEIHENELKSSKVNYQDATYLSFASICNLVRVELPLLGMEDYALGKISKFLSNVSGASHVDAQAFFDAVSSEIYIKSRYDKDSVDEAVVLKNKGLNRKEIDRIVETSKAIFSPISRRWPIIEQKLINENFKASKIEKLSIAWKEVEIQKKVLNPSYESSITKIKEIILDYAGNPSIKTSVEEIAMLYYQKYSDDVLDQSIIEAMILHEVC